MVGLLAYTEAFLSLGRKQEGPQARGPEYVGKLDSEFLGSGPVGFERQHGSNPQETVLSVEVAEDQI